MHFQLTLSVLGSILLLTNAAQRFNFGYNLEAVARALPGDTGELIAWKSKDDGTTEKDEFVTQHVQYRSSKGASDMEDIKWDDNLADKAAKWVVKCFFEHPEAKYEGEGEFVTPGQNLYRDSYDKEKPASPSDVTKYWHDEQQWYDINTNICTAPEKKSCGHYIQVVFSTAHKVGCARAYCKKITERDGSGHGAGWIVACNYESGVLSEPDQPGVSIKPYQIGAACTKCKSGTFFCKNNLCVDSCDASDSKCSCKGKCGSNGDLQEDTCTCKCKVGYASIDCSEECKDKDSKCGNGWYSDWCKTKDYVKEGCPKLCKTCQAAKGECKDQSTGCGIYPGGPPGYPKEWCDKAFVRDACPKMCEQC